MMTDRCRQNLDGGVVEVAQTGTDGDGAGVEFDDFHVGPHGVGSALPD